MIGQGISFTQSFSGSPLVLSISVSYYEYMQNVFSGKKALVVGGTGGLGSLVSSGLADRGAHIVCVGRHGSPVEYPSGPDRTFLALDLDKSGNRDIVLQEARSADILCVVRGPFLQKPVHDTSEDQWLSIVFDNLTFPGMLVSSVLPHMMSRQWGRILLFGGTRTDRIRGFSTNAAYAAAKTGLSSLVRSVSEEYARFGITCNALCPGLAETEYLDGEVLKALERKNPDGKAVTREEIARAAMFLLENSACNGVILPVDKAWRPTFV